MANNKMLIDASHPEETRVVVLRGNRIEEFDFESANKKPLRGNIYLAKVTRVEPSLQAAFVEYGGNRHGFLAFSEIHPDYYQIPVADRQALLEEEARQQKSEAEEEENRSQRRSRRRRGGERSRRNRNNGDTLASDPLEQNGGGQADEADPAAYNADSPHEEAPASTGETGQNIPYDESAPEGADWVDHSGDGTPGEPASHPDAASRDAAQLEGAQVEGALANADGRAGETGEPPVEAAPGDQPDEPAPTSAETPAGELEGTTGEEPAQAVGSVADETPAADALEAEGTPAATEPWTSIDAPAPALPAEEPGPDANGGEDDAQPIESRRPAEEGDEPDDDEDDGSDDGEDNGEDDEENVEDFGGDAMEDVLAPSRPRRKQYKIQEVIRRRQVLLIQVVKEERGNKGAALTTYLSLAGRYSVLMPNTARGGGISRKITDGEDRKRLKEIAQELDVPEGMGVILRTAGASRTKQEIRRDFEYLLRMWESVRELTLESTAPALVYEEGSLIKRSIRDLYGKDIDEVIVSGEEGYREAKDFMRMLMPSHAKNVRLWREPQPIFAKSGVEQQLDAMFSNQVTLKSGGYLVINQTEALVAIDVNSGRSTREHNIEDTALRTNLEAADEVARQLRLRDLAGLIVVDFIDMEEHRNNRAVERRIKEALRNDRARIQVGRISPFGLLEMSRQRMRTGVLEGSSVPCPHCAGAGTVRSTSSIALHVLRVIEDALVRNNAFNLTAHTRTEVALYILNHKRAHLADLEQRFGVSLTIEADNTLTGTNYHSLERGEPASPPPGAMHQQIQIDSVLPDLEDDETDVVEAADESEESGSEPAEQRAGSGEGDDDADQDGRRKRRRRRRRSRTREPSGIDAEAPQPSDDALAAMAGIASVPDPDAGADETGDDDDEAHSGADEASTTDDNGEENGTARRRRGGRRRRGRRGGRDGDNNGDTEESGGDMQPVTAAGDETAAAPSADANEPAAGGFVHPDDSSSRRNGWWVRSSEEQPDAGEPAAEDRPDREPTSEPATEAALPAKPEPVTPEPSSTEEATPPAIAGEEQESASPPVAAGSEPSEAAPDSEAAREPHVPELLPEAKPPEKKRGGWWQRARENLTGR